MMNGKDLHNQTIYFVFLILLFGFWTTGSASEIKIFPTDNSSWYEFGGSVSISGDYAVIGSQGSNDMGDYTGAAYVFVRDGSNWVQQQRLTAEDRNREDYFGAAVFIDADTLIIGAPEDDDKGANSGSAYIFVRSGNTWTQQKKLTAADGTFEARFGSSVALNGDYAIVGAMFDNAKGIRSGAAYVFKRTGSDWAQESKLTAGDGAPEDYFGASVSFFGQYALIGAPQDDDKGSDSGSAYIFKKIGELWQPYSKIQANDGATGDHFGASVSMHDSYIIVGAYGDDDSAGAAYLFEFDGTDWIHKEKFTEPSRFMNSQFGWSVSISTDRAIIGAYGKDTYKGTAYVNLNDGSQSTQIPSDSSNALDFFGKAVSISGLFAIVGAPGVKNATNYTGAAYIIITDENINLPPTLSDIDDRVTPRDTNITDIAFTIGDSETPANELLVTIASDNQVLIPDDNIIHSCNHTQCTMEIIPESGMSGSANIIVRVGDGTHTVSKPFGIIVNDPPFISDIPNQEIGIGTSSSLMRFTIRDTETLPDNLILSAVSSDAALLPKNALVFGGSGSERTLTITPTEGYSGTAIVTVTVEDGIDSVSDMFEVIVKRTNTPPVISDIEDATIDEDTSITLSFTINDEETLPGLLAVSGISSNTNLVGSGGMIFGGSGSNRTLKIVPAPNANGATIITVIVTDGKDQDVANFTLTVKAVNDPPTISSIDDHFLDTTLASNITIPFTIGDVETPSSALNLISDSSNTELVPKDQIRIEGSGSNRSLMITPIPNIYGISIITIFVNDGIVSVSRSFLLSVYPDNSPPTISDIEDQTIYENTSTGTIGFTIGDLETSVNLLTVSASSSDTGLVPIGNILIGGIGAERAVNVMPRPNAYGEARITLTVTDGKMETSTQFLLTVVPIIHPGDINSDLSIDLKDAILALMINTGMQLNEIDVHIEADVNGNLRIGLEEALYILNLIVLPDVPLGDVDNNKITDMRDLIYALSAVTGGEQSLINPQADVNGDGKIGIEEVIFLMQLLGGLN